MQPVKLIVFDCDGTLVDSQHAIVGSMCDAFQSEGLAQPLRASIVGVIGLSLDFAIEALLPEGADPASIDRLSEAYKQAFRARRMRPDHAEPLFPGVRELLDRLAERPDVRLAIATGKSRRGLDAVLEREGLTRHFVSLQTADTHPSKPHPSMIFQAMLDTGAEAADTVMIGDTVFDIEMALEARTAPIGVAWGYHPLEALREAGAHHIAIDGDDLGVTLDRVFGTYQSV